MNPIQKVILLNNDSETPLEDFFPNDSCCNQECECGSYPKLGERNYNGAAWLTRGIPG